MMTAERTAPHLIDRLPAVRGRLTADAPLAPVTWFRAGGVAEAMFRPADVDDLAQFLAAVPHDVPVTVLGVASNLLVRDGGVRGVVIRLLRGFAGIEQDGETFRVGAGALDLNVAMAARDAAIEGLEFLSGVPGTIGGGLRMNAGAYGGDMAGIVLRADGMDRAGRRLAFDKAALGFTYRHTAVPEDVVFTSAVLQGRAGDRLEIARRMAEIDRQRDDSQPRSRTGGSTFVNPPGARAWELIDRAGCRGLRLGGAQVSEKHCNFLINTGEASAHDIEALGEEVRRRVYEASGVRLAWEIRRIGEPALGREIPASGVPQ